MDIKITRLELSNFKCHEHLSIQMDGMDTSIYGDNATGKSSIYDALTWLLFGKDSKGRQADDKTCCVKPMDIDGRTDPQTVTAVEASFLADGEPVTLRRELHEKWTSRRGSDTLVYDGNATDYFIDGIPVKKMEYDRQRDEMIDEDTFRMLTDVRAFAQMDWQKRRAYLFQMAGIGSDKEIMQTATEFIPLMMALGKMSMSDLAAKTMRELKSLKTERQTIPQRIDENKMQLADIQTVSDDLPDVDALRRKLQDLQEQRAAMDSNTGEKTLQDAIRVEQANLRVLDSENREYRARQAGENPDELLRRAKRSYQEADNADGDIRMLQGYVEYYGQKVDEAREDWKKANTAAFVFDDICPTCGQKMPQEATEAARAAFERDKAARKQKAVAEADEMKQKVSEMLTSIERTQKRSDDARAEGDALTAKYNKAILSKPEDMAGYAERRAEIEQRLDKAQNDLRLLMEDIVPAKKALDAEISEAYLAARHAEQVAARAEQQRQQAEYLRQRIEELRGQQAAAARKQEEAERMLWLIEEFTRYKARFADERVNGMFRRVKFRLFYEQANGSVSDRCDVMVDGIPYEAVNSAMQVNAGIDMIRAISAYSGDTVPLFVDNAEGVTRLDNAGTQVIRLVVSDKDKMLRIEQDIAKEDAA